MMGYRHMFDISLALEIWLDRPHGGKCLSPTQNTYFKLDKSKSLIQGNVPNVLDGPCMMPNLRLPGPGINQVYVQEHGP